MRSWQKVGAAARVTAVLVCAVLCSAVSGWSQTRSVLTGTVTDGSGAVLPGATVVMESPDAVGGEQVTVTDAKGIYRFSDLPPGTYELKTTLNGFQPLQRTGIRLPFGTTLTVDMPLHVGTAETLVVEGKSPTVDVTTSQSVARVDKDLIQNLPLYSNLRESNNIFEMSPGSTYTSAFGASANNVMIDGTPATLAIGQSANNIAINPTWLEEVNVVAMGANAEYGEFGGVVANYVVRGGSNDFHGLLEYRTTRPSWVSDNTGELPESVRTRFAANKITSRWDSAAQVGGPILKDKLFFFAGWQYFFDETQAAGAPAAATTKWPRYVGKLNWAASKSVKTEMMYSYSKSSVESWAPNATLDAGALTDQPGHVWSGRVTWAAGPKTLWEFRTGGVQWIQDVTAQPPNTNEGPSPRRDTLTGISSGNTSLFRTQDADRLTFAASLTRHVDALAGRHVFKFGAEYENQSFETVSGFPGGRSFIDRNGVPDQVSIWAGDVEEGIGKRTTLYGMDDWKVSNSVTLQPGVRFSMNRGSTPSAGEVFDSNPISPRFGFAWDVAKDHKTVVRGQWGRFHAANSVDVWSFTDARRTPTITARVLPNGSFQEINRVTPVGNSAVDPDISQAYMDQFFIGVERELAADFSVKVQYIRKNFRNNYAFIDTRSVFSPVQMRDPGQDNVAGTADDGQVLTVYALTNPGQAFLVQTNPDGADRAYDGFQVIAQKNYSNNWQFLASYTRSESRGAINNSNLAQAVGTGGVFANPNAAINASGRSGLDFPNQASFRGTYHSNLIGGFNVSANFIYASGVAWSRTAVFRLPQGNVTVRVEPRGSEDALSTNQLDLRLEKMIPLGSRTRSVSFYVDMFNALNKGFPPSTRYNEASGATFGQPLNYVEGRAFKVAARLNF